MTLCPCSTSSAAATDESTPPDMATRTFFFSIDSVATVIGNLSPVTCCYGHFRQASNCVRGGPRPRPLPVRSSRRGEKSIALRHGSNCARGAPPYSLRLAPPPKTPGGGGIRSRVDKVRRTSLPHAVCGGGPGRGGAHHLAP